MRAFLKMPQEFQDNVTGNTDWTPPEVEDLFEDKKEIQEAMDRIDGDFEMIALATSAPSLFERSAISLFGAGMTTRTVQNALAKAGFPLQDIRVCELHDCFLSNKLIILDALGQCEKRKTHEIVCHGDITFGGSCIVNPSATSFPKAIR